MFRLVAARLAQVSPWSRATRGLAALRVGVPVLGGSDIGVRALASPVLASVRANGSSTGLLSAPRLWPLSVEQRASISTAARVVLSQRPHRRKEIPSSAARAKRRSRSPSIRTAIDAGGTETAQSAPAVAAAALSISGSHPGTSRGLGSAAPADVGIAGSGSSPVAPTAASSSASSSSSFSAQPSGAVAVVAPPGGTAPAPASAAAAAASATTTPISTVPKRLTPLGAFKSPAALAAQAEALTRLRTIRADIAAIRAESKSPNMETYASALRAALQGQQKEAVLELLQWMRDDGIIPYEVLAEAALDTCEYDLGFDTLLAEMDHMRPLLPMTPQLLPAVDSAMHKLIGRCLSLLDSEDPAVKAYANSSLYMRQLKLEANAVGEAVARYRTMVKELIEMGKGAEMKPAHRVLLQWYMPLVDEITAEQRKIKRNVSGVDRRQYGGYLVLLPADKLAVIVLHEVLGLTLAGGSHGVRFTRAALAVGQAVRAELNLLRMKKDKSQYKALVQSLTGRISSHAVNRRAMRALEESEWGAEIEAKVGSSLIYFLLKAAKVDEGGKQRPAFVHVYRVERSKHIGMLQCHPKVLSMVEAGHTVQESLHLRLLPMLIRPKPWLNPNFGGYLSINTGVMRTRGSHAQIDLLHECDPSQVFEGLDALSSTRWIVNRFILKVMREAWERGGGIAELPARSNIPLPPPPSNNAAPEKRKEYKRLVQRITQQNHDLYSLRCDMLYKLQVAEEFLAEEFYFPHNIDFRGRAYPIPPHLHHVGSDICRGLLKFAQGKPLGRDGLRWLKIHLGNLYGKDKLPFDERIKFTESCLDLIRDSVERPLDGKRWWIHADDPWQCLASCQELIAALDSPDPEKFVSHLPVHQDGSCNGLQHYAALGRDLIGARQVDLVKSERPGDVYTAVAEVVKQKLQRDAASAATSEDRALASVLLNHITRKVVKQTVMTSVYGVTFVGARRQIAARLAEREGLSEETVRRGSYYLTKATLESLGELFTGAKTIMTWLNECAKIISTMNVPVTWVTPMGLAVMQPYRKEGRMHVRTVVQNVTLADNSDSLPVSRSRQKSAFPPNFVHSLDSTHMLLTSLACRDHQLTFASVHDSYWTHACDVPLMNRLLREQFVNLHGRPILEHLRQSFVERFPELEFPPLPPRGDLQLSDVLHSPYFFD